MFQCFRFYRISNGPDEADELSRNCGRNSHACHSSTRTAPVRCDLVSFYQDPSVPTLEGVSRSFHSD